MIDEVDMLNSLNASMMEHYTPELFILEKPKALAIQDAEREKEKTLIKTQIEKEILKKYPVDVQTKQTSQTTSSTSSSGYGYSGYGSYTTSTTSKSSFQQTRESFDEIRKRAYKDAEQEFSQQKEAKHNPKYNTNPQMEYMTKNKASGFVGAVKKVVTHPAVKQAGLIAGIIGLQIMTTYIQESYTRVIRGDDKDKKK